MLSGWPMTQNLRSFNSFSTANSFSATSPTYLKNTTLLSYRYMADTVQPILLFTRPNHSILTVLCHIGGFAFIVWCVLKVLTYPIIWLINFFWYDGIFNESPKTLKQHLKKARRVNRELSMMSFLKMQILLRSLVKK